MTSLVDHRSRVKEEHDLCLNVNYDGSSLDWYKCKSCSGSWELFGKPVTDASHSQTSPRRAYAWLELSFCVWLPSTTACLCINWRSAAYIFSRTASLSHAVYALSFPSLCLSRSNSQPYLDTFFLICKVHPAPNSSPPVLPVSVGVKLAISFFFFFFWSGGLYCPFRVWKCFIGVARNNEDKAGLCGGRNAFLTHVNEWRLTFHSSRPFTEWQH